MTVEMAMLMPLILLVLMSVLFLFFWIHNRTWLTAASYEAALDGSMETVVPDGKIYEKDSRNTYVALHNSDCVMHTASIGSR